LGRGSVKGSPVDAVSFITRTHEGLALNTTRDTAVSSVLNASARPNKRIVVEECGVRLEFEGALHKSFHYQVKMIEPQRNDFLIQFLDDIPSQFLGFDPLPPNLLSSEWELLSTESIKSHLNAFSKQAVVEGRLMRDAQVFLSSLRHKGELLPITTVLTKGALMTTYLNNSTSPGIRFKRLGFKKKGDCHGIARLVACHQLDALCLGGTLPKPQPCLLGGRAKLKDYFTSDPSKSGRLIVIPDIVDHILSSVLAKDFQRRVSNFMTDPESFCAIGLTPFGDGYSKLYNISSEYTHFTSLDFSNFDQTIPPSVLESIFEIEFSKFEEGHISREMLDFCSSMLIDTRFAMPSGAVYSKHGGVASGDARTAVYDTISSWLMVSVTLKQLGVMSRVITQGDDVLIMSNSPIDLIDLARSLKSHWGLTISPSKCSQSSQFLCSSPDKLDGIPFLSYYCFMDDKVRPFRPMSDLYESILLPERGSPTLGSVYARLSSLYLVHFMNERSRLFIELFHSYLCSRFGPPTEIVMRDVDMSAISGLITEPLTRHVRSGSLMPELNVQSLYEYGDAQFFGARRHVATLEDYDLLLIRHVTQDPVTMAYASRSQDFQASKRGRLGVG